MSKNLSALSGRKGLDRGLFEQLGKLGEEDGTPDPGQLEELAKSFLIGTANTYGVATFYDLLRPENKGKQVYVCNGSACLNAGTQPHVHEQLTRFFPAEAIGEMCCLGRCHENAAFQFGGNNYSGTAIRHLDAIVAGKATSGDRYSVVSTGPAILTQNDLTLDECIATLGQVLQTNPEEILTAIQISGLRGRGGAGFPIGQKLAFCRQASGETKFVICNADEGDPGAYSDRYLLEHQPHRLLLGMLIAGYVTGASWGVLYIRAEYPESIRIMEQAVQDFRRAGLAGNDVPESGFGFRFKIIQARGAYICGEETALINSIEGQRPEVRVRPPYPAQSGLFGKPTVVNNVETLAVLPTTLVDGGNYYASLGTDASPGTKLLSLDGHFMQPGIYEVEMGTPLQAVIDHAGGFRIPVKALHIGGPLGGLVPANKFSELTIDFESFAQAGFLLGHASFIAIPQSLPLISYLADLFRFAAHESCGKCFPCRLGTKRAEELFTRAAAGEQEIDPVLLDDLLFTLESGSLCAHGGGIPLPVRNALMYFKKELEPYFKPRIILSDVSHT
ncbi:MAG: NAD(P)H-dependent oxidoreductase subunit E [Saprospiraceae bacterium]|nr:NAD(P)H-dependent oxidoreductase subunit E [Saprospiraceae bacterium]MCB9318311.1 NAD(P)H-dependent oxidoreductase subunit E [Lewinellaceae bacterium]